MRVIQTAILIESHSGNFNPATRKANTVKYIVVHYTGNRNDTARANCEYYRDNNKGASAHYYVRNDTVYQSVREEHAAYAVGLGARKEPYFKWPSMWKKITNNNSISVEICGSYNSTEGNSQTKDTAAKLVADLLDKYGLGINSVYRHYDVTGKECPMWAVTTPSKWFEFLATVNHYFIGKEDTWVMQDTPENYQLFKIWMQRYLDEISSKPADWEAYDMAIVYSRGWIADGRPKSNITRGELARVLVRLEEQGRLTPVKQDG